jgi:hypothetical protein
MLDLHVPAYAHSRVMPAPMLLFAELDVFNVGKHTLRRTHLPGDNDTASEVISDAVVQQRRC